jgi:class 3 adenylate cyclase
MSHPECISNRNIQIIATYVASKLGGCCDLFEGLPYPVDEYTCSDDFFLNEDEWTTYDNFEKIFRRARNLVNEPSFFFNCGASSATLASWGRFQAFARVFAHPNHGYERLPFFNKNLDDTKEIEVLVPPAYDRRLYKMRTVLKVEFHEDMDPHRDYIGDPYLRGILTSIPTIWGLPPASIRQVMNPYNPTILLNHEPEFSHFALDARIEGNRLILRDPSSGQYRVVGERVVLEPQSVNGRWLFLGRHAPSSRDETGQAGSRREAFLATETIHAGGCVILEAGEIYDGPYFILDVTYDRLSFLQRIYHLFNWSRNHGQSGMGMVETIDRLRMTIKAKNDAYRALSKAKMVLEEAKERLAEQTRDLELKVRQRTQALELAHEDLMRMNRELESTVNAQVLQLQRYHELRRYLSPKLTEEILRQGQEFGTEPRRKLMTVVFSDMRGFSSLTDNLEPEEIFQILNQYHSEMVKIIHRYDGTLNKIIGDGLLIFFGDPIAVEDHAERAVRMAVDMQEKVAQLQNEWQTFGQPIGVGIGISTGFMTLGSIGSDYFKDYTVIGTQVNLAARLESMARPGQILVAHRTYSRVKDHVEAEAIGEIRVKGIHSPVMVYNVKTATDGPGAHLIAV